MKHVYLLASLLFFLLPVVKAQNFIELGTDVSGDCTINCSDIKKLEWAYDIGQDSAWFRVETYNARSANDAIYIHIDWDDDTNNGSDWTGGSYNLSFNQNRQINAWPEETFSNVEKFSQSGGSIISYDVNIKLVDDFITIINCKLSEIDSFTDAGIKIAASVGKEGYMVHDIMPENGTYSTPPSSVKSFVKNESISIYPNPAKDVLFISSIHSLTNKQVTLHSIEGKTIQVESRLNGNQIEIALTGLKPGMYFVRVTTDKGVAQQQITVQ